MFLIKLSDLVQTTFKYFIDQHIAFFVFTELNLLNLQFK
jgi:hypothetical protein